MGAPGRESPLASGVMASRIALVTDSTARLSAGVAEAAGIAVVPMDVIVNGLPFLEGVDIGPAAIAAALRGGDDVSTSRPAPERFAECYKRLADEGADAIVSAHLSADLSGTYQSALMAADHSSVPVHVIDSRTTSMALGYAMLSGAEAVWHGGDATAVSQAIIGRARGARVLFYVNDLEFLRRGGRIGAAAALVGTALRMKPILTLRDGQVHPVEKARTPAKALARLGEMALETARLAPADVCVQDVDTPECAARLADWLARQLPEARVERGSIGAVVGSHVGPGALAVIISPRI